MNPHNLDDWLKHLEHLHPVAIDMELDRPREVMRRMGLKRPARRIVTVTGTNGKGSTCALLASLIEPFGGKVGVYGSPHLLRYNERVRIQGREVTDAALCEAFAAVEAARREISLTYFEMGTLATFWLFERAGLDIAILEVGLGGRLDAVNLVDADVAVITSIGLDHREWLGDTRDSVAREKAGIMRPNTPVVCGELEPPSVLVEKSRELSASLFLRGRNFDLAQGEQDWHWHGETARREPITLHHLPMIDLPLENAATALQAYALLDMPWDRERLVQGLQSARLAGRLDRRLIRWKGQTRHLLLDVAHNPQAAKYLAAQLQKQPLAGRRHAVFSLLNDKDLTGVIDAMSGLIDHWAIAPLTTSRARPIEDIELALSGFQVSRYSDIGTALEAQCAVAEADDEIVVFGSFYCVADALRWLETTGSE